VRRILVVGGGYAGFYTAWRLEKKLRRGEAEVVVVDPRPYMTYQPFLPEVVAGSVEARHAAVSLRRNLRHTKLVAGMVTNISHADRTVTIHPADGPDYQTVPILIARSGTYPNCAKFLHRLRKEFPDTAVRSFETTNNSSSPDNPTATFQVELVWHAAKG